MKLRTVVGLLLCWVSASVSATGKPNIDPAQVTVAGMSAGAQMAHQLHVAYPELFSGAALIAGGPFACAEGSLATAMSRCMGKVNGKLPVAEFLDQAKAASATDNIGDLTMLGNDRVWIFHGALDNIVAAELSAATVEFYQGLEVENIRFVDDVQAAHTFPTLENGSACDAVVPPFVAACNYDAAGESLQYLYGELNEPAIELDTSLTEVRLPSGESAGLLEQAFIFTPPACRKGGPACKAQLVLHGCNQSSAQLGTDFIEQSGYLQWAESNDIVLAFPQVAVAAANPYACWDWWGYTGDNYRWRDGAQMKILAHWIRHLEG